MAFVTYMHLQWCTLYYRVQIHAAMHQTQYIRKSVFQVFTNLSQRKSQQILCYRFNHGVIFVITYVDHPRPLKSCTRTSNRGVGILGTHWRKIEGTFKNYMVTGPYMQSSGLLHTLFRKLDPGFQGRALPYG